MHTPPRDSLQQRLDAYTRAHGSRHAGIHEAAQDESISTSALISLALECEANQDDNHALYVLHTRAGQGVRAQAFQLLLGEQAVQRCVGAQILRELPGLDHAPHESSALIVEQLWISAQKEDDLNTLSWIVSAIGWQKLSEAIPKLMHFRTHPEPLIREGVASGLFLCMDVHHPTDEALLGLLELARDPVEEVAGSVLYDVAHYPELFERDWADFKQAAVPWIHYTSRIGTDARRILNGEGVVST